MKRMESFNKHEFLNFCMALADEDRLIHFDDIDDIGNLDLFLPEEFAVLKHNVELASLNCDVHAYSLLAFHTKSAELDSNVLEKLGSRYQAHSLRVELGFERKYLVVWGENFITKDRDALVEFVTESYFCKENGFKEPLIERVINYKIGMSMCLDNGGYIKSIVRIG